MPSALEIEGDEEDTLTDATTSDGDDSFLREVARIDDVTPPSKRPERPGERLGDRYRLRELIGAGGQGSVWDAEDALTGERVAVKILKNLGPTCAARVRREIAVLRLLRLPGVVRLIDEGLEGGRSFLVTERIFGGPFPGLPVPCTWSDLEPVLLGLLETLGRIHAAGIVHRDLKPDNVLVGKDKRPVVLDFGLSFAPSDARDRLTDTGQVVGTLSYVAPEQLRESRPTARTDLYAVGVMAHYALTGRVPHERRDMCEFILARLSQPVQSLLDTAPEVPPEIAIVLDQLLAIDPADRPRSAIEVSARLRDRLLPSARTSDIPPPLRRFLAARPPGDANTALLSVFSGPDRLLHLREDAARVLHARTGGEPDRTRRELEAWVRAGLARWDGDRVAIDRGAIEELEAGLVVTPSDGPCKSCSSLSARQGDLVAWVVLAGTHATIEVLSRARGEAEEDLAEEVSQLVAKGALSALPEGRFEPTFFPDLDELFSAEARLRAHRALASALPRGAPGRLVFLLKGEGELDRRGAREVAREVMHVAWHLAAEGHTARATLLVGEGVRALRENPHLADEERIGLFSVWVEIALAENTPLALDRVLYELCRPPATSPKLAQLVSLVRAGLAAQSWAERAFFEANQVPRFDDPALERLRQGVRVLAARRAPLAVEEATLAEVLAWAEDSSDEVARARASGWLGRLRYRQGRFDEAAACHAQSASGEPWLVRKLWARLLGASALLEAFRFDEAEAAAREALELARRCRQALCEGRAEWVLRSIHYRTGALDAGPSDLELIAAAPLVGSFDLEPLVCLTEAAVAKRAGNRALARDLGERAHRVWWPLQERVGSLLGAGLFLASGGALSDGEVRALVSAARSCTIPGVGIQALALLHEAGVLRPEDVSDAAKLAALVPEDRWDERMDVLSVKESLERLS